MASTAITGRGASRAVHIVPHVIAAVDLGVGAAKVASVMRRAVGTLMPSLMDMPGWCATATWVATTTAVAAVVVVAAAVVVVAAAAVVITCATMPTAVAVM